MVCSSWIASKINEKDNYLYNMMQNGFYLSLESIFIIKKFVTFKHQVYEFIWLYMSSELLTNFTFQQELL